MFLGDRVFCQALAFGGPATVLGKNVHRKPVGRWAAIVF